MRESRTGLLIVAFSGLAFVGPVQGADAPSFKTRGRNEKEFVTKVGEAVVKSVRPSPAKLTLGDYKITAPKPNRKVISVTMNWVGSVTGKRFASVIRITVDP